MITHSIQYSSAALPLSRLGYETGITWKRFTTGGSMNREQLWWLTAALWGKCWPQDIKRRSLWRKKQERTRFQSCWLHTDLPDVLSVYDYWHCTKPHHEFVTNPWHTAKTILFQKKARVNNLVWLLCAKKQNLCLTYRTHFADDFPGTQ